MSHLRLHVFLVLTLAVVASACSAAKPSMSLIGVKTPQIQPVDGPEVQVFVEVHNPGDRDLRLDRMEYELVAEQWLDSSGKVDVGQMIGAGASAIVEIRVPVHGETSPASQATNVPYQLRARLFATDNKVERSWRLRADGVLEGSAVGGRLRLRPIRVAGPP